MNNPYNVSINELIEFIGITEQRIGQLVFDEVIIRTDRGQYDLKKSIFNYCLFVRTNSRSSVLSQEEKVERLRILKSKAQLSEIEAAEKMGLVVRLDAIQSANTKVAISLRNSLSGIADRTAPILAASSDSNECHHLINKEVKNSLESAISAMKNIVIDDSLLDLTNLDS